VLKQEIDASHEINDENPRVLMLFGHCKERRDNKTEVYMLATPYHIPYRHHPESDVAPTTLVSLSGNADTDSPNLDIGPEPETIAETRGVRGLASSTRASSEGLKSKSIGAWSRAGNTVGHNEGGAWVGNFEVEDWN